jgi:DNA-binding GntR family transcriptional regulator
VEKINFERSKKITKYHEEVLKAIIERNYERTVDLFEELLEEVRAVLMGE